MRIRQTRIRRNTDPFKEVRVKVVSGAGVLVCIGARQRGRSSTLQDARPAPTSDRGVQGKRQREREQINNKDSQQHMSAAGQGAAAATPAETVIGAAGL